MCSNFILQEFLPDVSICNDIIEYHETSTDKTLGMVLRDDSRVVDKTLKDSIDVPLFGPVAERYFSQLQTIADKYVSLYPQCNMYSPWRITTAVNIQKYEPKGGFFPWHTERVGSDPVTSSRHLVFMTYLNDVTDGGETEFQLQDIKVQPKKGLTLIWPADWTHTHRGLPSATQTKYIVTGWFNYF